MDFLDGGIRVAVRFKVEGDDVCPCFGKVFGIAQRLADHQVYVEDAVKILADALHNRCAEGDVGNKMSVHDIDVQPRSACLLHFAGFLTQLRKICGQNRRGNLYHKGHDLSKK